MSRFFEGKPVLVTGATGYIAGWVVRGLLDAGATVHATVRDLSNPGRLAYLRELADKSDGELVFFEADLLEAGSFDAAAQDCSVIFHIASPYTWQVSDPQKELVDPALEGTRNVLAAAGRAPGVKRVVLTSSCLAIYGDNVDVASAPNGILTEEVWNTSSSLSHQPYAYSKTVAEREAWKIAEGQEQWSLVVINPSAVFGPGVRLHEEAQSVQLLKQFGDGTFKSGVGDIDMGMVDVRDVAAAHIAAAMNTDATGRFIVSGWAGGFVEIASTLRTAYGDYPIPTRSAPKPMLWLLGPLFGMSRKFVSRNVGHRWNADNSKSVRVLGVSYRPLKETLTEHFEQLVEAKLL